MNYDEFIKLYPWVDLCLEFFKAIVPTLVALLAIYINNKSANKREENKRIHDEKAKTIVELQNDAINVNIQLYEAGSKFLNFISYLEDKKISDFYLKEYEENIKEALQLSRKILLKSHMEEEKLEIPGLSFRKCFDEIAQFNNKINEIIFEYDNLAVKTAKENRDIILDKVQAMLIEVSQDIESKIMDYVGELSNLKKNLK